MLLTEDVDVDPVPLSGVGVATTMLLTPCGFVMLGYLSGQLSSLHSRMKYSSPSAVYLQMFWSVWVQVVGERSGHCQGSKVLSWSSGVGLRDHAMSCDMVTMYTSSRLSK